MTDTDCRAYFYISHEFENCVFETFGEFFPNNLSVSNIFTVFKRCDIYISQFYFASVLKYFTYLLMDCQCKVSLSCSWWLCPSSWCPGPWRGCSSGTAAGRRWIWRVSARIPASFRNFWSWRYENTNHIINNHHVRAELLYT